MKGEMLKVLHKSAPTKNGGVKITSGKPIEQKIKHGYADGRVRTITGDVWEVRRIGGKLETVR